MEQTTMPERKYTFSWDLLGDIDEGRPNLGPFARLEVYRLMAFSFRDVLERHFGAEKTDQLFFEAGKLAGGQFYANVVAPCEDFNSFIAKAQAALREMAVGVLRVEKADMEAGQFVVTVSEDLDCSGLPDLDYESCVYDEGFLAGMLESFSGKPFKVKEVDCWTTGERTCRFIAEIAK